MSSALKIVPNNLKTCRVCQEDKPETVEYFIFRKDSNKFRNDCISCNKSYKIANYRKDIKLSRERSMLSHQKRKKNGKARDLMLRSKFNIDSIEYNYIFNLQEGKCKLCQKHQSELKRTLAVDHCHTTGKVRGLLCDNCNLGLGNFQDNQEVLIKAAKYLAGDL